MLGGLRPTGLRPAFISKFEKQGLKLPAEMFGADPPAADAARRALQAR